MTRRRIVSWWPVVVLVAAALLVGWGIGSLYDPVVSALSLPRWPWWGPRVRVGEREFRPDLRPRPDVTMDLQVWDVDQPARREAGGWPQVLAEGIEAFRARYPNATVQVRVLPWREYARTVGEALRMGQLPDVLGTPDAIYLLDARWQVPLRRYMEPRLPRVRSLAIMPGAWDLVTREEEWWGVPRWVEWHGWLKRAGAAPGRVWVDSGHPLTWRYLAMTLTPPSPEPVWQRQRLEAAAAWMAAAPLGGGRVQSGVPLHRPDLSLLEPLYSGEADAVGPVSGRLLRRLGAWPYPASATADVSLVAAPGDVEEAGRLPGPLLSASGYLVLARPGADDVRVQLAFELAWHLARWTARALAGFEGVVPVWNPQWQEPASRRQLRDAPPPDAVPWWHGLALPPGIDVLLQTPAAPEGPGASGASSGGGAPLAAPGPAVWGARPWQELSHELDAVREAADRLASGRAGLAVFLKEAASGVTPTPSEPAPAQP
ncbi:hypothetical protein [Geochorda subterranea]|uniref:Extracellular solute-binding protein n=1 Tax=Geochorda subterranea TaxID=3109564 RepID=A0ABZ1BQT0_9FIRM|nr:hypothetical protein [Limnochorda sp. LNt]WRP15177.1 hypothetical protein VLY81_03130 [Limnochorda sp. LNt]